MKHKIETPNAKSVDITVTASADERPRLLRGIEDCQAGRCGCSTNEYAKIESMVFTVDGGNVGIHLQAKDGVVIEVAEIEKCLFWAEGQARKA